jgi:hypothetical protein
VVIGDGLGARVVDARSRSPRLGFRDLPVRCSTIAPAMTKVADLIRVAADPVNSSRRVLRSCDCGHSESSAHAQIARGRDRSSPGC